MTIPALNHLAISRKAAAAFLAAFIVFLPVFSALAQGTLIPLTTARGMVFDHAGNYLYIATSDGLVQRFNLTVGSLETPFTLGGSLNGVDVAPDDSFLLVAQNNTGTTPTGAATGTIHRVDTLTGLSIDISYNLATGELGAFDVAVAANGIALFTTRYNGSGFTPLHQLNLATNVPSTRSDVPGGMIDQDSQVFRGADGTRLYVLERTTSAGFVFTYTSASNNFAPAARTDAFLGTAAAAVSRDGSLLLTRFLANAASVDTAADYHFVRSISNCDSGVAFDASADRFYGVNASTDEIIAYDSNTFIEQFRINVGENVSAGTAAFGLGKLIASSNGRYLALRTPAGVRVFDIAASQSSPEAPAPGTPRGIVFDHSGHYLYVATSAGLIRPYNLASGSYETPYDVGGSLKGIDISPDDSFVIVAQDNRGIAEGAIQKLDLQTGAVTNISYKRNFGEGGAWDVAIAANHFVFLTGQYLGSGPVPLRQFDLTTQSLSTRTDVPPSIYGASLYDKARIHRSADGERLLFATGGFFSYDSKTNVFGARASTSGSSGSSSQAANAVNRDGTRLATLFISGRIDTPTTVALDDGSDMSYLHSFTGVDSGVAFDATKDVLYAVNSLNDEIVALDTTTFSELYRLPIGGSSNAGATSFGAGTLIASQDGKFLALELSNGIQIIPIPNPAPNPTPTPPLAMGTSRSMIFDHASKYLYITTFEGVVDRYNIATGQVDASYNLGGSLTGLDIAPDDSFLLVAQNNNGIAQSAIQKVDLPTGTVTNLTYVGDSAWDVAIASNGLALFTTRGGTFVPLRQLDLSSNEISNRSDAPDFGTVTSDTRLPRSADRSRIYVLEQGHTKFVYTAASNTFGVDLPNGFNPTGAMNRNGTLLATQQFQSGVSLASAPDFTPLHNFAGDSGIAFDAVRDILYAVNSSTDEIVAYDTNTYMERARISIGEDVNFDVTPFGTGTLVSSQDGNYLAFITDATTHLYSLSGIPTPTPTVTPTPTPSPTPTPTATPTPTPTPTPSPTPTPTPSTGPAEMQSPQPGSTFTSSTVMFTWSAGAATTYYLAVGSSQSGSDIYSSGTTTAHSATVNNIPTDGRTIYVTLASQVSGSWSMKNYTYTAFSSSVSPTPTPTPSATPGPTATPTPTPTPTPTVTPSTVAAPIISPGGGTFRKSVTFHISDATAGATIHYTTDGSDPTNSSPVYSVPTGKKAKKDKGITLKGIGTYTVKGKAVAAGAESSVTTAVFNVTK